MLPPDTSEIFQQARNQWSSIIDVLKSKTVFDRCTAMSTQSLAISNANKLPDYDGNLITIKGKKILALAGPIDDLSLNKLLHNLSNSANPVAKVIALSNSDDATKYFARYFQVEFPVNCENFEILKVVTAVNGNNNVEGVARNYAQDCIATQFKIISNVDQRRTTLEIYSIPLFGGGTVSPKRYDSNKISILLNNYIEWVDNRNNSIIAIHCEQGLRRTALIAVVYFLVAQFDQIFIAVNPDRTVDNFVKLFQEILQQRHGFRLDIVQFYNAIDLIFGFKMVLENLRKHNKSENIHEGLTITPTVTSLMSGLSVWSRATSAQSAVAELDIKQSDSSAERAQIIRMS